MKVNNALKVTVVCSQLLLAASAIAAETKSADIFYYNLNLKFKSPISQVGTYPGFEAITSGILFTTLAQVSSTVEGLSTTIVVLGSP